MDDMDSMDDMGPMSDGASRDDRVPSGPGTRGVLVIAALLAFGLSFLGLLYLMTRDRMHPPPVEHRSPPGEGR